MRPHARPRPSTPVLWRRQATPRKLPLAEIAAACHGDEIHGYCLLSIQSLPSGSSSASPAVGSLARHAIAEMGQQVPRRTAVVISSAHTSPHSTAGEQAPVVCLHLVAIHLRHHDHMELRPGLRVDAAMIADFATRHGIRRLELYGSVLRDDFNPASDVDILVEFHAGRVPGLIHLAQMELELEATLGRPVELRTYEDLSRYFRDKVAATARPLYAA